MQMAVRPLSGEDDACVSRVLSEEVLADTAVAISDGGRRMRKVIFNFVHGVFRAPASQLLGGKVSLYKAV